MQSVRTPRAMKETVKTRPSREYGVLQHSAILKTGREEGAWERRRKKKDSEGQLKDKANKHKQQTKTEKLVSIPSNPTITCY